MAPCCSYTVGHYFGLYMKPLAQRLRKCVFFCKIHVCDHLWPSRSPHVIGLAGK